MSKRAQVVHKPRPRTESGSGKPAPAKATPEKTAASSPRVIIDPKNGPLMFVGVIHVLGREEGKTLCGKSNTGHPANPVQELWASGQGRHDALTALRASMGRAVEAFGGALEMCRGCDGNVARMEASASAEVGP